MARTVDGLDLLIIRELQRDGRQTVSQLATTLNTPRSTVTKRLQALEQEKVIRGYGARVDHKAIGEGLTAFVLVQMERDPVKTSQDAGGKLARVEGVEEVHQVTGDWDLIVKMRAKDHDDLLNVLHRVVAVKGLDRTSTMTCFTTFREMW